VGQLIVKMTDKDSSQSELWAIIAIAVVFIIIVVIIALAVFTDVFEKEEVERVDDFYEYYFGVNNPGRHRPSVCIVSAPLACDGWEVQSNNVIMLSIRNGAGEPIRIKGMNITGCKPARHTIWIDTGKTNTYGVNCDNASSGKFKGDITIEYLRTNRTFTETVTGTISIQN